MVDGLKMIHNSTFRMRSTMKAMKVLLQTMKFNFAFENSYSEYGKDSWSFYSMFFHSHAAGFHSDSLSMGSCTKHSATIRWGFGKNGKLLTAYRVCGMMKTENTLRMLFVNRIIVIRPYSGLFTLAHQRKMLTLYSWGRKISIDCLQILLMAQDSDSVHTQIGIRTVHIELCSSTSVYRMYRSVIQLTLNYIEHWTSAVLFCQLKTN